MLGLTACGGETKQEFRVNLGGEPSSLDPQRASFATDFSVIRQVFKGLVGFKSDLSLEPIVATQLPTVENGGISQDGLTYTFNLRNDVTWSDGKKVTANDFTYAIKRLLDPSVAAPYSSHYTVIKGAQEYNSAVEEDLLLREALRDSVAAEAIDEYSLRIILTEPNPSFLQKMALPAVYPVRQDIIERFGDRWTEAGNYIGNGPYVMTEWVHQDHITLDVNSDYWASKPRVARMTLKMISDPNAELAAYRAGELELSRVPAGIEKSILADPVLGSEVVRSTTLFTFGLFFNTAVAPFDNRKVRQAFATAIDRAAWIDKVKNGVGSAATSWLPPGMPGHDPELGKEYAYNPQRARLLLSEAGFPGGEGFPSVAFTFVDAGDGRLIAQFIQAQMKDNLEVDLTLQPLDPPSFGQQVVGGRQFQITVIGWGADYPNPESFLSPLFVTESVNNILQYSNADFDSLVREASMELDQGDQRELWKRAHRIIVEEAPVAFFYYQERFILKKPEAQGLTLTAMDEAIPGDIRLPEVHLTR